MGGSEGARVAGRWPRRVDRKGRVGAARRQRGGVAWRASRVARCQARHGAPRVAQICDLHGSSGGARLPARRADRGRIVDPVDAPPLALTQASLLLRGVAAWGIDGYLKLASTSDAEGGTCGILQAGSYPIKNSGDNPTYSEFCGLFGLTECGPGYRCDCQFNLFGILCLSWACAAKEPSVPRFAPA